MGGTFNSVAREAMCSPLPRAKSCSRFSQLLLANKVTLPDAVGIPSSEMQFGQPNVLSVEYVDIQNVLSCDLGVHS